ncbi:protein psiR-like [Haliotis asinina]|uniref:protein psiR-like n=1 Tax=Haliotis asinina TaxID=109174 RepID=UPI003531BF9E
MAVVQAVCLLLLLFISQADGQACEGAGVVCVSSNNCPSFGRTNGACAVGVCCSVAFTSTATPALDACNLSGINCVASGTCPNPVVTRQCPSGQVCCVDPTAGITTFGTNIPQLTTVTTTLAPLTTAGTTLAQCSGTGVVCIDQSNCNPLGRVPGQCPSGQVCCSTALTSTGQTAPLTTAGTTLAPCTIPGVSCVSSASCPLSVPGFQCPSGQVCCAATTTAIPTTTTLPPCNLQGIECVTSGTCTIPLPLRRCPSGQECCVAQPTTPPPTTSPPTTGPSCIGSTISCVAAGTCPFEVLRDCPSGQVCCASKYRKE